MGFGDVNRDGRPDIACAAKGGERFPGGEWFAVWLQPESPESAWEKRLLAGGEPGASNILPADFDSDGHIDFVATRGHGNGILCGGQIGCVYRIQTPGQIQRQIQGQLG